MKKIILNLVNTIIILFTLQSLYWVVLILNSKFVSNFSAGIIGSMSWLDMFLIFIVILALLLYIKLKNHLMITISVVLLLSRIVLMIFAGM